ncbi:MAG: TonB-dependent receptor, partial [Methylococcaceae bacterium]|nr:TonB-dependent receptor [Methylococcaceae bacterium]
AQALGATSLEAEESEHFTAGLVYKPSANFSVSGDYFYTKINNRIIFSRNITPSISPEVANILAGGNLFAARFFTNALDTETQGYDLRADYKLDFQAQGELKLSALYHYNKTKIKGGVRSPSILGADGGGVIFSDEDQERLESGQPNESLILTANYKIGDFNSVFRVIKAGAFSEEERRLSSQWLADVDIAYQIHNFNIAVGAHNLFNSNHRDSKNSVEGIALQNSPYGYNGGFYYLRLSADF